MSDSSTSTTGFVWSVEGGGAISVSGLYTAPSASQETPITVKATKGGKSGTSTISAIADPEPTIVSRGPIAGKVGGSTTAFSTMFTVTNSAGGDYDFVVTPTEAGTVSAAGLLTLADTATGTVSVAATHKTKPLVTATCEFTGVTPKPKTVTSVAIQPTEVPALVYGETVQFSGTIVYSDGSSDTDLLFVAPIGFGQIGGKSGLYTAPSRTIETPFTIEVWAASDPTSKAYATIAGVKAA